MFCIKILESACSYCIVDPLCPVMAGKQVVNNEMDCPLYQSLGIPSVIPSVWILQSVCVVHECTNTCKEVQGTAVKAEHEQTMLQNTYHIKHDYKNELYCFAVIDTSPVLFAVILLSSNTFYTMTSLIHS